MENLLETYGLDLRNENFAVELERNIGNLQACFADYLKTLLK